jgi:hypothetical protein
VNCTWIRAFAADDPRLMIGWQHTCVHERHSLALRVEQNLLSRICPILHQDTRILQPRKPHSVQRVLDMSH